MELFEWTALQLGEQIRSGKVSIPEVTRAALDAAKAKNPENNAFITLTEEEALARAEQLQKGVKEAESPLYGVPMAYKDNICTKGVKTTCASKILGEFRRGEEPGKPRACARWQQRRRGGCGGCGRMLVHHRQRYRRLYPAACLLLRCDRHQAHLRNGEPVRPDRLCLLP